MFAYPRRKTREVAVGNVGVGGDRPIAVQSMTTTDTRDFQATLAEIRRLEESGCEIVRVAVPDRKAAANLEGLRAMMRAPLIADIHFNYHLAFDAIEAGVHKVRINPGNIGKMDKVREIIRAARNRGVAMRVGVNSGSVEKDLLEKHGWPSPEALVESALRWVELCESEKYFDVIVSLKSSDVPSAVESCRRFSRASDYPLHLGITEAGLAGYGTIKSAAGIGALLVDGIGDTIRISLVGDPVVEVRACWDLLKATGRRVTSPEIVACPTCGRIEIDLEPLVKEVQKRLDLETLPMKVSILGCAVNGPGEAAEADIGLAGGKGIGIIFRKGVEVARVPEAQMVDALCEEIRRFKGD
ncbi:MAG: flavodoxin-dependent (E)-4-hydroxy-3-methylbut-2-enyl-diphosphate synthase [Planctomycetes bacterium]|nr:flavodoxin-dependent (E)-4-hydroxy-3-methylbut-2-enyl-diphosphate synthase [Planctomycetota bacterium]